MKKGPFSYDIRTGGYSHAGGTGFSNDCAMELCSDDLQPFYSGISH